MGTGQEPITLYYNGKQIPFDGIKTADVEPEALDSTKTFQLPEITITAEIPKRTARKLRKMVRKALRRG